jgi:TRAP-type C4-dicarboxylate transport system permease small subunit
VAAAVSAFALLQVVCIALAIGGLLWIASVSLSGQSSSGNLVMLAIAMAVVYLVLLVVLVRAITRRFYRRQSRRYL